MSRMRKTTLKQAIQSFACTCFYCPGNKATNPLAFTQKPSLPEHIGQLNK